VIESFNDPEFVDSMERKQTELDAETLQMIEFREAVQVMPGPMGVFFRAVGHAHDCYEEARTEYATTEGEPQRWMPVVESAVELWEHLRDGGRL
jgi:hypothetical protein